MSIPIPERPYFPAVEKFLRLLDQREDIRCVCLMALTSRDEPAHCFCGWHCNPFDVMEVAGTLQLIAAEDHIRSVNQNDETKEETDEDDECDNDEE